MKRYKLFATGPTKEIPTIIGHPEMTQLEPYEGSYSVYIPECAHKTPNGFVLDHVNNPPTQWSGGLKSVKKYHPPFHVQIECPFLYNPDLLESVWLLNDACNNPTSEIDCFESGLSWHRRLMFSYHYGDPYYANRKIDQTEIICPPSGSNAVDVFMTTTSCEWYLNGRLMKRVEANFDYDYTLLITIIALNQYADDVKWEIEKLAIR